MNLGETVAAAWTSGGGQVLVQGVDNKTGEFAWRLKGTWRLAVVPEADGMIHTGTGICPG